MQSRHHACCTIYPSGPWMFYIAFEDERDLLLTWRKAWNLEHCLEIVELFIIPCKGKFQPCSASLSSSPCSWPISVLQSSEGPMQSQALNCGFLGDEVGPGTACTTSGLGSWESCQSGGRQGVIHLPRLALKNTCRTYCCGWALVGRAEPAAAAFSLEK